MTHFIVDYGLWFLFGIICLESAGLWLPGETALIAAGVYASKGHLSITAVIVVAAVAAIIGDNIGSIRTPRASTSTNIRQPRAGSAAG